MKIFSCVLSAVIALLGAFCVVAFLPLISNFRAVREADIADMAAFGAWPFLIGLLLIFFGGRHLWKRDLPSALSSATAVGFVFYFLVSPSVRGWMESLFTERTRLVAIELFFILLCVVLTQWLKHFTAKTYAAEPRQRSAPALENAGRQAVGTGTEGR